MLRLPMMFPRLQAAAGYGRVSMPFYFSFAHVQLPHAAGPGISEVNLFIHGLKAMQCVAQDLGGQERMTGDIE